MKKLLLLLLAILNAIQSSARSFTYEYEGQTITYYVTDEDAKTCKTATGNWIEDVPGNRVSGDLILPSRPQDGDVEYTLTEIGMSAFAGCRDLTSIIIPNSVKAIRYFAFAGCSSLTAVEIPNSVTIIDNGVFEFCRGLTSVVIPNSVTSIDNSVFESCSSLTSIKIPNSVQSIGYSAFANCSALTSVIIPNSVNIIHSSAFEDCNSLTWVVLPNHITHMGSNTFEKCKNLIKTACPYRIFNPFSTGIKISYPPEGAINEDGFVYGADKSAIYFAPLDFEGHFTISDSVETIGSYAFYGCGSLTSVEIPNSVTSIDSNAFQCCSGLTSVTIGNAVTTIGSHAFYDCSTLTSLTLSKNLNKIESQAFYGCDMIKTIIYPTQTPCDLDNDIFMPKVFRNATLYLPNDAVETFKSTTPWSEFRHIKGIESSGIEDVLNNSGSCEIDYSAPYEVYNLNGVKVGNSTDGLAPGLYIVRQGRAVEKIALPFSYF